MSTFAANRSLKMLSGAAVMLLAVLLLAGCKEDEKKPVALAEQGWSPKEQVGWYHANQGSRLIPMAWLAVLEEAQSQDHFFSEKNIRALGYIPADPSAETKLPVGFSIDVSDDSKLIRSQLRWETNQSSEEPWIGMTCAACHTNEIIIPGGEKIRILGGAGMGDFQTFIEALNSATEATLNTPEKFSRFAKAVLKDKAAKDSELLKTALQAYVNWQNDVKKLNLPEQVDPNFIRYGYGRLDAFGNIFNKVALMNGAKDQFHAPSDAPVSYPFLWNINQHVRVQWNGIAVNEKKSVGLGEVDIGALGRNSGEVVGVFGDVNIPPGKPNLDKGYKSSINVKELDAIELQLAKLLPPAWPAKAGALDPTKLALGKKLFDEKCASCHKVLDRNDLTSPAGEVMIPIWGGEKPVGTDPWMACNAFTYRARSGNLEGVSIGFTGTASNQKHGAISDDRSMLSTVVAGALVAERGDIIKIFGKAFFGIPRRIEGLGARDAIVIENEQKTKEQRLRICKDSRDDPLMRYKSRPLSGIWATAPYLHNGSVPSLYELLLPAAQRPTKFPIGSQMFDPIKVGYVADSTRPMFEFNVLDSSGNPILGNSNSGHDYGNAALTDEDRWALVEYMKSL